MKKALLLAFLCLSISLQAQLNRFPYVQATTTNSTIIAWKTGIVNTGSVKYGTDPANLDLTSTEASPSKLHGVTLDNLQPDTKYYYEIYADGVVLASEYFWTASDSTDQQFSFLHYGDCGYNNTVQHQIGALMEADDASFGVVCGDIDQGGVPHITPNDGGDNYDEIFFNVYNDGTDAKMLAHECHYTSIGNHDTYKDNAATYLQEFFLPHNNAENSERYYSFEWGDAKFIALDVITPYDDTTFPVNSAPIEDRWWTDFRPGSPQYQFLEDELRCNDRKWTFIFFHEGPWTNYWGSDYNIPEALGGDYYQFDGNVMVRQHLVPLFEQYGVDFVLVGHSHLYERGEKNGVIYVTSGSAGDSDPAGGNTQYATHPEILLSILDNVYVKFNVDNDDVNLSAINKNNNVVDAYSHSKTYTPYSVSAQITDASCIALSDGGATLSINGPRPPYTVEWDNGSTDIALSGVEPGTYYALITDANGCEKVTSVEIGDQMIAPDATFTATEVNENTFDFSAQDITGTSYDWDYGDGNSETLASPTTSYSYSELGTYTVTLTITAPCGTDMYTSTVTISSFPVSVEEMTEPQLSISPNPFSDITQVRADRIPGKLWVSLYHSNGRLIRSFRTRQHTFQLKRSELTTGRYILQVTNKKGDSATVEILVK